MKKLGLLEVKSALRDPRFQKLFPELKDEIEEFIRDPSCSCNMTLYQKIMSYKERLQEYFPNRVIETPEEEAEKLAKNQWRVINCHINELETNLRNLPHGRKQIAVARYQEQVTVIINELGFSF